MKPQIKQLHALFYCEHRVAKRWRSREKLIKNILSVLLLLCLLSKIAIFLSGSSFPQSFRALKGRPVNPALTNVTPDELADFIIDRADTNDDKQLSRGEFMTAARNSSTVKVREGRSWVFCSEWLYISIVDANLFLYLCSTYIQFRNHVRTSAVNK